MACLQPWWHSSYLSNSAEDIAKKRCAICSGEPQPGDAYWNGKYYYGILVKGVDSGHRSDGIPYQLKGETES